MSNVWRFLSHITTDKMKKLVNVMNSVTFYMEPTDAKAQSETGHTRLAQFEFSFFFSITRYLEKYWCICLDYMTRDFRDKEMKLGENRS